MKGIVKKFGTGLHIILNKKDFKEDEVVEVLHKTDLEKLIDSRIQMKLDDMKAGY